MPVRGHLIVQSLRVDNCILIYALVIMIRWPDGGTFSVSTHPVFLSGLLANY
jgi:hypothetical protein